MTTRGPDQRCPQRVDQGGQRPHVVRQFLAFVAQCLNLGLRGRIRDGQAAYLPVGVPQRHRGLAGTGRLDDGRRAPEPDLLTGGLGLSDDAVPRCLPVGLATPARNYLMSAGLGVMAVR